MEKVKQIKPVIDPDEPTTDERWFYYLLKEPNSPPVTPPNAVKVSVYQSQQYILNDPLDFDHRPWGMVEYSRLLSFAEIDKYELLPFEPYERMLFDLWLSLKRNKKRLRTLLVQFVRLTANDPDRKNVDIMRRLVQADWTNETVDKLLLQVPEKAESRGAEK